MDKLKFALFSIVTLSLLGLMVYWAVNTIQSGSESANAAKINKLENENEELQKEAEKYKNELTLLKMQEQKTEEKPTVETPAPVPTVYKYQDLINELQKLIDGNAVVKLKSTGGRVGTIQKFLNIYNKTSNKIDNDFGPSMQAAVIVFQKDQGLPGDGEAGKTTFSKMIDWLKKSGN